MISSTAYRQNQKIDSPSLTEMDQLIQSPDIFLWVRLDDPTQESLRELQKVFSLHELAVEDAGNPRQRPKLEAYGETLFMVLPTISLQDEELVTGEVHMFIGPQFFISIHHRVCVIPEEVQRHCQQLPAKIPLGSVPAAYALMDAIVDHQTVLLSDLRDSFQVLEASIFQDTMGRERLEQSYLLKRHLMVLEDAATAINNICGDLMRLHEDRVPKSLKAYLRDVQDHATRVTQGASSMREMLMEAMQVNLALVSIGQNETAKTLAGWAAILAIPTVVFGLYGMNFKNMPELDWRYGYFIVLGATFLACTLLFRRLRRIGWL
jgi:magnesium transporter